MKSSRLTASVGAIALASGLLTACASSGNGHKHHHYSEVYLSQGQAYCAGYDNNALVWYLLYSGSSPALNVTQATSTKVISSGTWVSASKPADPVSLSKVVPADSGKPGNDVKDEDEVDQDEIVDENTTPEDVQQDQQQDQQDVQDEQNNDNGGGDDNGGGGDDGGGGDAGGGDAGGGGE